MLETKKLLGSTKSKIAKDKNGKNVPHLEITEVLYTEIIHYIIVTTIINMIQDICIHLVLINGQLLDISPKNFIF